MISFMQISRIGKTNPYGQKENQCLLGGEEEGLISKRHKGTLDIIQMFCVLMMVMLGT